MTQFDSREFRNALGHFATGVVIVTANFRGQFLGTTISSFNSVSLTPPLVLFSIARSALGLDLWRMVERYGVTVLAEDQSELSNRFARPGANKFKDLRLEAMEGGSPLLPDWLAYFECKPYARYDGGDHEIFVGEVLVFSCRAQAEESRPLVLQRQIPRSRIWHQPRSVARGERVVARLVMTCGRRDFLRALITTWDC
jgi:flavin reductase (DIM6/NTAB) family NADH-FMN oxidoreductase RutF